MGIANDNGRLLRQARVKARLTQDELGAKLDPPMNKQGVYKLEKGLQRITAPVAAQLAGILGLKPADLADEAFIVSSSGSGKRTVAGVRALPVLGVAQAGYWAEGEAYSYGYDPETGESFEPTVPVLAQNEFPERLQYALLLEGTSLNKTAPPGSYVICVRLEGYPSDPDLKALEGKLVHVERHRAGLVETTVKRLKRSPNGVELWPESHDPKHQAPVPLKEGRGAATVQIVGVVIGRFENL